jgi:hypothetical protein
LAVVGQAPVSTKLLRINGWKIREDPLRLLMVWICLDMSGDISGWSDGFNNPEKHENLSLVITVSNTF